MTMSGCTATESERYKTIFFFKESSGNHLKGMEELPDFFSMLLPAHGSDWERISAEMPALDR